MDLLFFLFRLPRPRDDISGPFEPDFLLTPSFEGYSKFKKLNLNNKITNKIFLNSLTNVGTRYDKTHIPAPVPVAEDETHPNKTVKTRQSLMPFCKVERIALNFLFNL